MLRGPPSSSALHLPSWVNTSQACWSPWQHQDPSIRALPALHQPCSKEDGTEAPGNTHQGRRQRDRGRGEAARGEGGTRPAWRRPWATGGLQSPPSWAGGGAARRSWPWTPGRTLTVPSARPGGRVVNSGFAFFFLIKSSKMLCVQRPSNILCTSKGAEPVWQGRINHLACEGPC